MKKLLVLIILIVFFSSITILWWTNGLKAVDSKNTTAKIFVIKKGQGVREIANQLKQEGLIKDPIVFFLNTKRLGLDKQIQAGDFRLNPSMNSTEIAQNLTHGMLDIWVTIPEGKRAEEIADELQEKIPTYQEDWRNALATNEGYLFPDTYLIPRDANIDMIVSLMKNNFNKKFDSVKEGKTSNLSDEDVVKVASLVEREAKHDTDRPMVASVIENRLEIGMGLQIDATVQYLLGYQPQAKTWWKKELTLDDLAINSPYNTYKTTGLPPTPISNPGLSAIRAALNPSKTSYIYYLSDKNGVNHYAKTLAEHNANIKKYGL
ncbi:endolytic transglycosylase MltG [Patescibacteria group bacterium]|nr:endolytic transglycosylase MltG [Patescibacteria group bacterium]